MTSLREALQTAGIYKPEPKLAEMPGFPQIFRRGVKQRPSSIRECFVDLYYQEARQRVAAREHADETSLPCLPIAATSPNATEE